MAKELPYFKFEPNAWENGNIQICSREDKGLFLDVCSMYWSRLGVLPFKLAVQKLCNGNATAFDSLINESIFQVIDDMIYIEFLNEQLQEFEDLSETNRKNALEGWRKRKESKNKSDRIATASKSQSETDAIRGDEIIEEKSKEEETKVKILMSEATASDVSEKNKSYFDCGISFYQLFVRNSTEILNVEWKHLKSVKAESFLNEIRLMIETDNRTMDDLRKVWEFLKSDDFWMQNIQSSKKLREKFDQLITKAKNNNTNGKGKSFTQQANEYLRANDPDYANY